MSINTLKAEMASLTSMTSEMTSMTPEVEVSLDALSASMITNTLKAEMTSVTSMTPEAEVSLDALSASMLALLWPTVLYLGLLILLGLAGNILVFIVYYKR